jgi:hypothetical protein
MSIKIGSIWRNSNSPTYNIRRKVFLLLFIESFSKNLTPNKQSYQYNIKKNVSLFFLKLFDNRRTFDRKL